MFPRNDGQTSAHAWGLIILFCGFIAVLFVLFPALPKADLSREERRALEAAPRLSWRGLWDGSYERSAENYISDHFPFRKAWLWLEAHYELYTGRNGSNGVYAGKDGYLIETPVPVDSARFAANLEDIRLFAESAQIPVSVMAVPSAGFVLEDFLPGSHMAYPDGSLSQTARARLGPAVQWIDLADAFRSQASASPLYYKTDHHWTSRGAYLAYSEFAAAKGMTPFPEESFEITVSEGFYGTTYAKSRLWESRPDSIELWRRPVPVQVEIQDSGSGESIRASSMFFEDHLNGEDPYSVFLDGNHAQVRMINPAVDSGKLLIVKDSFAHCLAPFLAGHYREIQMIDLRYYRKNLTAQLVRETGANEVLFVYGAGGLAGDGNFVWLRE
ncbi:MAG: hypothetical protein LBL26_01830 [Peptococcaceae bacterium]|jgi:hypothetical protein|nr:hypothetical protein [Peptococcaceae bacterium]